MSTGINVVHCWKCGARNLDRVENTERTPLTLRQIAAILAKVGADPDAEPGGWHLEFARAIELAHGISEESAH